MRWRPWRREVTPERERTMAKRRAATLLRRAQLLELEVDLESRRHPDPGDDARRRQ